jgi:L-fuculose-phosphate aldolase
MDQKQVIDTLIHVGRRLYERELVAGIDGNLSCRLPGGEFLITATGTHLGFLTPDDFAVVDPMGRARKGKPSSEYQVHLVIYHHCPDARFVFHAHPPTAVAWSLQEPMPEELPSDLLPEVHLGIGRIPVVPYATPGTRELAQTLVPYLPKHRSLILARHGAVSWGERAGDTVGSMEQIEHVARIIVSAHTLGKPPKLSEEEIDALDAIRRKR